VLLQSFLSLVLDETNCQLHAPAAFPRRKQTPMHNEVGADWAAVSELDDPKNR